MKDFRTVHIVGIGGAGMSAIARVLKGRGVDVRGSDLKVGRLVDDLRAEGIPVAIGHTAENVAGADLVLASSAVPEDNVELVAARERGISVMRRPAFLPLLTADHEVIAVTGAHGKTTVTGMIATILLAAGRDPTYIVGGVVQNLGTNAHAGAGPQFVIEADEYRNTFLALEPTIAVVTNIEYDHPDCFSGPRFLRLAFGDFVDRIRPGGLLVACNDDEVAHAVAASYHANGGRLALYGLRPGKGLAWRAVDVRPNAQGGVTFTALRADAPLGEVNLQLPGDHNAENALAALAVTVGECGVPFETARTALARFAGTARRFEVLGEAQGVTVVDDYAHHPTQIRVLLRAAAQHYPQRRLIAVWQPHTFSRIKALWDDFLDAFAGADRVLVLPIYAAREVDDGSVDHYRLAAALRHPTVEAATSLDDATDRLQVLTSPGDVILLMGAGDEYLVGEGLLAALRDEEAV
ncbi:MAG: UDP-N-acetylmuramate--L-alanine ligase [Anaerolineae bacterium]